MALPLGFGSSRAPKGLGNDAPTTTTTAPRSDLSGPSLRPRARPRPMGLAHQDRDVLGLEDADLLDLDSASIEPLGYVFGLARPRVRGPFSMRTVSVRQSRMAAIFAELAKSIRRGRVHLAHGVAGGVIEELAATHR